MRRADQGWNHQRFQGNMWESESFLQTSLHLRIYRSIISRAGRIKHVDEGNQVPAVCDPVLFWEQRGGPGQWRKRSHEPREKGAKSSLPSLVCLEGPCGRNREARHPGKGAPQGRQLQGAHQGCVQVFSKRLANPWQDWDSISSMAMHKKKGGGNSLRQWQDSLWPVSLAVFWCLFTMVTTHPNPRCMVLFPPPVSTKCCPPWLLKAPWVQLLPSSLHHCSHSGSLFCPLDYGNDPSSGFAVSSLSTSTPCNPFWNMYIENCTCNDLSKGKSKPHDTPAYHPLVTQRIEPKVLSRAYKTSQGWDPPALMAFSATHFTFWK